MYFIEERVLLDGNFLIFSSEKPMSPNINVTIPEEELNTLKAAWDERFNGGLNGDEDR